MSQFFDLASMVLVPSGYRNGKLYSQKPLSSDGELTFSRASNATRVNSSGLVEKVRENVLLQSESFDNAAWTKLEVSVTANAAANPLDGESTADNIVPSVVSGGHYVNQLYTITANVPYTISVYAKANGYDWIYLYAAATGSGQYRLFNVANGTLGISNGAQTSTITAVGGGWYRCTMTWTPTQSVSMRAEYSPLSSNSVAAYAGDGTSAVLFYAAQLETGDIATDYIATTSSAVSVGPVSGLPRLDYSGGATCPSLLLEPQRTNSITSSESTATGWTFTNSSSAVNQTASPDGYVNADSIIPDATSGQHAINSANITASGSFTLSAFVKAGEHTKVAIRESANTGSYASFNLATGTKIEDNVSGASFIQSYGNGWYRIGVTGTFSGTIRLGINVLSNAYTTGNPSSGTTFFSGNGTDKLFCWGMQCELGATYASSYINTLSTAVTRVKDAALKTGIASLIGQSEGTLFIDIDFKNMGTGVVQVIASIDDSANNKRIEIWSDGNIVNGFIGATGGNITIGTTTLTDGHHKLVLAYKQSGDHAFYIDGTQIGTSSTAYTIPSLNNFRLFYWNNLFYPQVEYKQALLFPTRLPNSDLASITSL